MMGYLGIGALVALATVVVTAVWKILWRPYDITKHFEKQGIIGPRYSILGGSLREIDNIMKAASEMVLDTKSNDITKKVYPHYHIWSAKYGEKFLCWHGRRPVISIGSDPELAKQILSNKFGFYVKPKSRPTLITLAGNGLVLINGLDWIRHRRILNPGFTMDKLKVMTKRMAACTMGMIEGWKNKVAAADDQCMNIEMSEEFQKLAADIIAHTAFGSSYRQGRQAFNAQKELQYRCVASMTDVHIPGTQYLPTPSNIRIWMLDWKVKNSLKQIINDRIESSVQAQGNSDGGYGDDLLGLMIEASKTTDNGALKLNMNEIVDECKTFFFAGHETTGNLLTWTILLLSLHQEWQDKLRQEVLKECRMGVPEADMLTKLKLVNMVLLETLRLYGPVIELFREASKDMELGNLTIPKGVSITIPFVEIHRSKEYWGEDANEFNPSRFKNGVSHAAKHPSALIAFGLGPRACIGQNFAMLEAKMVLALLLQRFAFLLSPEYKHAPTNYLTLQPQYGLPVIVKPLESR